MSQLPRIKRGPIDDLEHFRSFSNEVPSASPDTPDRIDPDVAIEIRMRDGREIRMPDGKEVEIWYLAKKEDEGQIFFPSQTLRFIEGQIVHATLNPRHGPHTIHWHGIEPTTFNDGVGHISFEVAGNYTYQWMASYAGTYLYHCHRNTVLHFEMGMAGPLIIDPPQGEGFVRRENEIIPYDVERIWMADEIDSVWHTFDKDTGIGGFPFDTEPASLHDFKPDYFFISGVPNTQTATEQAVVANVKVGETLLLRLGHIGYTRHRWLIGHEVEVIAMDGRTLGSSGPTPGHATYNRPFKLPPNTPIDLTTAQRWDVLVRPTTPGSYPVRLEYRHVNTARDTPLAIAETFIHVA